MRAAPAGWHRATGALTSAGVLPAAVLRTGGSTALPAASAEALPPPNAPSHVLPSPKLRPVPKVHMRATSPRRPPKSALPLGAAAATRPPARYAAGPPAPPPPRKSLSQRASPPHAGRRRLPAMQARRARPGARPPPKRKPISQRASPPHAGPARPTPPRKSLSQRASPRRNIGCATEPDKPNQQRSLGTQARLGPNAVFAL